MMRFLALGIVVSACACNAAEVTAMPQVSGWELQGQLNRFTPDTLYKAIDGEADMFLPYGLRYALFQDYANAGAGHLVNAELYHMRSPLDAFGIYSVSRSPRAKTAAIGDFAGVGSTQIVFCKGEFFVRLTASKADGAVEALTALGTRIASALPASEPVKELAYIDVPEVDKNSAKFIGKDALDIKGFDRVLVADTRQGALPAKVFVALADTPEKRAAVLGTLEKYAADKGAEVQKSEGLLLMNLPNLHWVAAAENKVAVVGVAGLDNVESARPLLQELVQKSE
jgi:hypothetical protein